MLILILILTLLGAAGVRSAWTRRETLSEGRSTLLLTSSWLSLYTAMFFTTTTIALNISV